jgi:hypothetical protein
MSVYVYGLGWLVTALLALAMVGNLIDRHSTPGDRLGRFLIWLPMWAYVLSTMFGGR